MGGRVWLGLLLLITLICVMASRCSEATESNDKPRNMHGFEPASDSSKRYVTPSHLAPHVPPEEHRANGGAKHCVTGKPCGNSEGTARVSASGRAFRWRDPRDTDSVT